MTFAKRSHYFPVDGRLNGLAYSPDSNRIAGTSIDCQFASLGTDAATMVQARPLCLGQNPVRRGIERIAAIVVTTAAIVDTITRTKDSCRFF